jgi:hypothetical protein
MKLELASVPVDGSANDLVAETACHGGCRAQEDEKASGNQFCRFARKGVAGLNSMSADCCPH